MFVYQSFQECECLECDPINWQGDGFCDDDLNTIGCKWDGGDCCHNLVSGWNNYCTVSLVIILKYVFSAQNLPNVFVGIILFF